MKARTIFIGFFGFLLLACREEPPRLPEETQEGKRTFGCLLNGELIDYHREFVLFGNPPTLYAGQDSSGQLLIVAKVRYGHTFAFFVSNPSVGECPIDSVFFYPSGYTEHYVARGIPGIRLTQFDSIVAGTFSFDANCYDAANQLVTEKTIRVRKGRFDLKRGNNY